MECKQITRKLCELYEKYKYAFVVLIIGVCLLLVPGKQQKKQKTEITPQSVTKQEVFTEESLAQILQAVEGAGKVRVLLSIGAGEEIVYQTDTDASSSDNSNDQSVKTVITTDSQRSESGLIRQVNPAA